MKTKIAIILTLPLSIPILILIRLLRPWVLIRFGHLYGARIGHLAHNTELMLYRRPKGRVLDFAWVVGPISNRQLLKMWKQHYRIYWWVKILETVNLWVPGMADHHFDYIHTDLDYTGERLKHESPLKFTWQEEEMGWRQSGLDPRNPFVCYHYRTDEYEKKIYPDFIPSVRNVDSQTIRPALNLLEKMGYQVIQIPSQSDFLDIFLLSKCHFFIGTHSGLSFVPLLFRRPVVLTNFIPSYYAQFIVKPTDIVLFKKVTSKQGKEITFYQQVNRLNWIQEYKERSLTVTDNTESEITKAILEMKHALAH